MAIDRWYPRIVLAACLVLPCLSCPARAEPVRVDAGLVCSVQHAIRWRDAAWQPAKCEKVAAALNDTPNPVTMAAICTNESDLRDRSLVAHSEHVFDIGLCGVRCVTDDHQRCTNGPAKGLEARKLLDPAVNVRIAAAVLASHGGSLQGYSGSTRERGYGARIAVLVAALGGELRIPKRASGAKWERIRTLAKRIVEAVKGERRS